MVTDKMGLLFEELGKRLNLQINPDPKGCCRIRFKNGVEVQLEPSSDARFLTLLSNMGDMAPGRYRENVLREALKANGQTPPLYGIFAFSKKNDAFYLFDQIPLEEISGDKLFDYLQPFLQKAEIWQSAISRGEVPSYSGNEASFGRSGGMFGLK